MLRVLDEVPAGLLEADSTALADLLGGPTLIHLSGRRRPALFITVLMHGNETTGFEAVKRLLMPYRRGGHERELPRALSLFIGNVAAARLGLRRLDGQPDYNRVWSGGRTTGDTPEHAMMRQVVGEMARRRVFASVDVHNNTGLNPHYACVNRTEHRFLQLASLFGRTVVYFIRPDTVQSMALAELCPAVTLECGQPGKQQSVEHAHEYLQACLHLSEIPDHPVSEHDLDLFHTVATVKIPEHVRFAFQRTDVDLCLVEDLDRMNFTELPVGTSFGSACGRSQVRLEVVDEHGRDVSGQYFTVDDDGELRTRVAVMPAMLTLDERVIRQDCLCYLMERCHVSGNGIASDR